MNLKIDSQSLMGCHHNPTSPTPLRVLIVPAIAVTCREPEDVFMATNPVGKDTKTIGINMNKKMADELEQRANSMHLSTSKYCKLILITWIEGGKKLTLQERG